jgi:hypothetical protein
MKTRSPTNRKAINATKKLKMPRVSGFMVDLARSEVLVFGAVPLVPLFEKLVMCHFLSVLNSPVWER